MKCFECESEAVAVCRYCGRAVCRVHAKEGPVLNEGFASYGAGATGEWLEIGNAVCCGTCKIKGHRRRTEADKFFNL